MKNVPDNFGFGSIGIYGGNQITDNITTQVSQVLVNKKWKSPDIIDFDSFKNPRIRNNFHLFFHPKAMFGAIYRSQNFFVKFHTEYPDLVQELDMLNLSMEINSEEQILKLYEAYVYMKIMNPHMLNEELFR